MYSKNAIPQLATITRKRGAVLYLRWPYQAKVMKTLATVNSSIGNQRERISSVISEDKLAELAHCENLQKISQAVENRRSHRSSRREEADSLRKLKVLSVSLST